MSTNKNVTRYVLSMNDEIRYCLFPLSDSTKDIPVGNRLSRIYTRTGDDGTTGLADGSRIPKDDVRVESMGELDELNSTIGLLIREVKDAALSNVLLDVQHTLFDIGGELAIPGHKVVTEDRVTALENHLDELNGELEPLKEFILPGGSEASARCHLARSVCRRAERKICVLSQRDDINPAARHYVNRLSDYLFVLARTLNKLADTDDVLWRHERKTS